MATGIAVGLCATALLVAVLLVGCSKQQGVPDLPPGELIFDWYSAQAGLPMEPGYDEMTLTSVEDPGKVQLDVYSRPTGDGQAEQRTTYLVSSQAIDDAMKLVSKYRMASWDKLDPLNITGHMYVCKFYSGNEFIRVSSDHMPANGPDAFGAIEEALGSYIDPSAQIESPPEEDIA